MIFHECKHFLNTFNEAYGTRWKYIYTIGLLKKLH